jgi:hypothetical protein
MTRDADLNFSDLITLEDACKHFLGGKVTVATLRALHKVEKLEIYRIGRRDFTTVSDLKAMQQKCRVEAPARNSGSTRRVRDGRSVTEKASAAQTAVEMKLKLRKQSLRNT